MGVTEDILAKIEQQQAGNGNNGATGPGTPPATEAAADAATTSTDTPPVPTPDPTPAAITADDDIPEEKLLAALKKRGHDIASLEQLKVPDAPLTEEQKKEQAKRLRAEAIAYGLTSNKFTQEEVEAFAVDQAKTPAEIAKTIFTDRLRQQEPNLTEEELNERFDDWMMTNAEDGNWQKKMRQDEISNLQQLYIENKYGKILGITNEYQQAIILNKQRQEYDTAIEKAAGSLPDKMTFEVPVIKEDGTTEIKNYSYTIPKDAVAAAKAEFLKEENFHILGKGDVNAQAIQEALTYAIKNRELDRIIATVSNSHASEQIKSIKMGRQGIMPTRDAGEAEPQIENPTLKVISEVLGRPVQQATN